MTRIETVRSHLKEHGYITPGIAMLEYGMTNGLAQRICDLRSAPHHRIIDTVTKREKLSGRTHTRYELVS